MDNKQKEFKRPPKKYQPRGLSILYEDRDIIVIEKASGLLTMGNKKVREQTAYFLLNNYVKKGNPKSRNRILIVHRLDKDTSGVLVFAKDEKTKRFLQDEWHNFSKTYYAVLHGVLDQKEGVITSYLAENGAHRMYSVKDSKKGKLSKTGYKVIRETNSFSLVEIDLMTGRKHQIRVNFADQGCPVAGDKLYGENEKEVKRLALHAASLTIAHPFSKEMMTFQTKIPSFFNALVKTSHFSSEDRK